MSKAKRKEMTIPERIAEKAAKMRGRPIQELLAATQRLAGPHYDVLVNDRGRPYLNGRPISPEALALHKATSTKPEVLLTIREEPRNIPGWLN